MAWAALWMAASGLAQADSLTVEFASVRNAEGRVMVSLCGDANGSFPGGCSTHSGMADAVAGRVVVEIEGIPAGRYAIQAFHDANGNFRPEIPPEGYAFGNDASFPPTFSAAAVEVRGASRTSLKMQYAGEPAAAGGSARGSHGAEPPPGVERREVREQGLYGAFYVPAGRALSGEDPRPSARRPAMLLLGGSEGGLDTISAMATSFAEAGFAVLALAYFAEQGLPATLEQIPLEYFDRGVDWLARQPQADPQRLGVLGWSRGSEAALLVASRNRNIKAVIGLAPSGVIWQGLYYGNDRTPLPAWTLHGKPLPSLQPDAAAYRPGEPLVGLFLPRFDALQARRDVQIPVERIRASMLLISGGRDAVWPAARFADHIAGRLQASRHRGTFQHLHYPDAGHAVFVGHPQGPMARALDAAHQAMGGTPVANRAAWQDSWQKTLQFLHETL